MCIFSIIPIPSFSMPTRIISNSLSLFPQQQTQFFIHSWHWVNIDQTNEAGFAKTPRGLHQTSGPRVLFCAVHQVNSLEAFSWSNHLVYLLCKKEPFCSHIIWLQTRKENEMSCCKPSQVTCPLPSVCESHVGHWKEDGRNYVLCTGTRHNSLHILQPVQGSHFIFRK